MMNRFRLSLDPSHPRTRCSLNGEWALASGTGEAPPSTFPHRIAVPSVVDCATPPFTANEAEYYWYAQDVDAPSLPPGSQVWLRLEQVQFGTEVWVDGRRVGGSIACATSQEYRIDEFMGEHERHLLIVRVGTRQTLPPEHAAGRDQEKEVFTPGVWGDVSILVTGSVHCRDVLVLPSVERGEATVSAWLVPAEGLADAPEVHMTVLRPDGPHEVATAVGRYVREEDGCHLFQASIPISQPRVWSPEDPFLYQARVAVNVGGRAADLHEVRFGMRDFRVVGSAFHLNGRPIFLRGGNIAFHRFLSDEERARLPWDMEWVRKAFIDIPREHHFNFFRFHLGRAYHRWYDLADEHGLLLQDEWQFWNATGANSAVEAEFRQWIKDNGNHPSIVIWDPLNESADDSIVHDIVPGLRTLDPTRPWESVDFHEQHPYIYSLGMTLNHRQFGYTRALPDLERSVEPVVVNEFLWWWFDSAWQPTVLMTDVVERWLGRHHSLKDIVDRQAYLAEELVGLFRRMRCAAIQPFVYLSNNRGPTAHWFEGPVRELRPKPFMQALRNAFAPFGVSIELWDRHVECSQRLAIPVHVVNDTTVLKQGTIIPVVRGCDGLEHRSEPIAVQVPAGEKRVVEVSVAMPADPGTGEVRMELLEGERCVATARRSVHIFSLELPRPRWKKIPMVLDPGGEVEAFLRSHGLPYLPWEGASFSRAGLLFVNSFGLLRREYAESRKFVDGFVNSGGTVVVQEPEFRVVEPMDVPVTSDLAIRIARRADIDRGGYDSYVFPEDPQHPLWASMEPEHFRWFNGGVGGEIVSEYTVEPSVRSHPLASCGLGLRIPAVSEIRIGHGKVIISRIQVRGRLDRLRNVQDPCARRFDPVAARYLINLLSF